MKLAIVQMSMSKDPSENLKKALSGVEEAAAQSAEFVLLPELFHMRYPGQEQSPAGFDAAISSDHDFFSPLREQAQRHNIHIAVPFFERRLAGIYSNSMMLMTPDQASMKIYRKTHIPDDPGFSEKYYFTPGEEGFCTWNLAGLSAAPLICWDQWFPEAARICALMGAQLLLYPTAVGWLEGETSTEREAMHDAWITVQRSHAITNGLFVAAANRIGIETASSSDNKSIEFWGSSFIAGPDGRVLVRAGDEETVISADLDLRTIEKTRRVWPFLRDRRIDLYQPLTQRHV